MWEKRCTYIVSGKGSTSKNWNKWEHLEGIYLPPLEGSLGGAATIRQPISKANITLAMSPFNSYHQEEGIKV